MVSPGRETTTTGPEGGKYERVRVEEVVVRTRGSGLVDGGGHQRSVEGHPVVFTKRKI